MKELKLSIDLLPKGAWGNDLSKTLPKADWDTLRNNCYKKANHTCQICGCKTDELDAHEVWTFDVGSKTQTLADIIALCSKCHGVKHFRNSERLGFGENAKNHFLKVNNCSVIDFASHCAMAEINFNERNKVFRWLIKAPLEKFGGKGIEIKQRQIPMIKNPYEHIDWATVKYIDKKSLFTITENHDCLGAPCVFPVEVDNYQGTIKVNSNYSNKIEWYLDEVLIKTKFNVSGEFITELKVEDLEGSNLQFRLSGDGGTTTSKAFTLSKCL